MILSSSESKEQFLSGGGEMGKLIRSMDWSSTALGPIETWPQSLRTSVSLCLSSTFPILIAWGPDRIQIYNDSYRPICGAKHPQSMGMPFRVCWETALPVVGDAFERGGEGEGTYINDQRMFLDRYGYIEEAWMTFSFAPIRDESGGVGGIFHPITETTAKMLSGRRTQVLKELGVVLAKAKSIEEIGSFTQKNYPEYLLDIPFILIYKFDAQTGIAHLINSAGLADGTALAPVTVDLSVEKSPWPFAEVNNSGQLEELNHLQERFGTFNCEPYANGPESAMILPLKISGQEDVFGFVVAGVSASRALDSDYHNFYDQLANTFNTAVSNVYAFEQEQKRAEALAAIDRSKTAFFSNVSHEFRTPLTLILGPLDDLLNRSQLPADIQETVQSAQRNALRLLKLVNNLLDYSRVEAGRTQAAYQKIDLAELTTDLASSFRSIIEKAGMQLIVDSPAVDGDVYVDRQMWEKIVLNLLSNAFKYTLEGTITLTLFCQGNSAVLQVSDTGVGIPQKELPHMFERFHRVENSAGRTHEGTGIGLSLVYELVQLHGGQISVSSIEGSGSTFTVVIPMGKAHLPPELIQSHPKEIDTSAQKTSFIEEASGLLQTESQPVATHTEATAGYSYPDVETDENTRILIVDDNADMRAYLNRILEPYFTTAIAVNGQDALSKIPHFEPDLVLSDIMMPVMDGKTMLEQIRQEHATMRLPVIFLSARAGEEARIDGLEAGADDYLVKPFSASELLTKISTQIKITKARNRAEQQLRNLITEAPVAIAIYRGKMHTIEMANDRMLQYWGRTANEVIAQPLLNALPELASQGFKEMMDHVYQTGERFISGDIPVQLVRFGKKEELFINLTIEALREDDERVTGMMAVAADVTAQVLARHELERVNDTLKLAVDAAAMGIWRSDLLTGKLIISERARILHGFAPDVELTFLGAAEMVVPEHREKLLSAIAQAVENKGSFNEDYQITPIGSNKPKWLNTSGMAELNEKGEAISVIGTILDITEIKEDSQRKDDFIGMVSHELKTPLTTLSGFTQVLQMRARKSDDSFATDKLDRILRQVKKMGTMINGFLNVSRLQSGKIVLATTKFDLNALISEIIDETELSHSQHQLVFEHMEAIEVDADRDKIGSVISNLLSNAIKYSPDNKLIKISSSVENSSVTLAIHDQGMGIKPEDLEKLFERFYRVESNNMQHISGFGIGLYLSSEIIERHGGRIWAESELGKGATFFFSLPVS
ncbi:ATP-binding protein [Pedobacter sp. MR2016-24]|uniref:ATP-binding protein n=1 Tax=Pedobacter sp. MR2016-24 TaxID=2994466 RepID=UPI002245F8F7|nr:ATP-binding protein [Pedobacter sp. MR2016-24]MCX2483357.1 ATP-binding protein [Pedobacter sp. MR2016-24]